MKRTANLSLKSVADIPAMDLDRIVGRQQDFTDLCVYVALSEYILPLIADFGNDDSAERKKMGYYSVQAEKLLQELVALGDWYDFDSDGVVEQLERDPGVYIVKRVR